MNPKLLDYFSKQTPVGPIQLDRSTKIIDEIMFRYNAPARSLRTRPPILFGRRGSGKSSLLRSVELRSDGDKRNYHEALTINLPSDDVFQRVVSKVNTEVKNLFSVEQGASVWSLLLWNIVIATFIDKFESGEISGFESNEDIAYNLRALRDYISEFDIPSGAPVVVSIDRTFAKLQARQTDFTASDFARYEQFGNITLQTAISLYNQTLSELQIRSILLIDNLEKFKIDYQTMMPALSGYLKALTMFQVPGSRCDARCCIPTELYKALVDRVSSAPMKDFAGAFFMRWTARELLQMAASRLSIYSKLHAPKWHEAEVAPLIDPQFNAYDAILHKFLPREIKNAHGNPERTIPYIMRHTQLLPRHLLLILNEIFQERDLLPLVNGALQPNVILEAVSVAEGLIAEDIINGFTGHFDSSDPFYGHYNHGKEACEAILRHLPPLFSYETFASACRRRAPDSIPSFSSEAELFQFFLEMGCIGKHQGDTDLYRRAIFEYTLPNRLTFGDDDRFCVHPVFSGNYGSGQVGVALDTKRYHPMRHGYLPVYPYGAAIDDPFQG